MIEFTKNAKRIYEDLLDGTLSEVQFHNKKNYAKRSDQVQLLVDMAGAWEAYKFELKKVGNP